MAEIITGSRAVDGTEWCLFANASGPSTQTTVREVEVWIDTTALASNVGTVIAIRGYEKVRAADAQHQFMDPIYVTAGRPMVLLPLHMYRHGYSITAQRASGSGTPTITWSIRSPGT